MEKASLPEDGKLRQKSGTMYGPRDNLFDAEVAKKSPTSEVDRENCFFSLIEFERFFIHLKIFGHSNYKIITVFQGFQSENGTLISVIRI